MRRTTRLAFASSVIAASVCGAVLAAGTASAVPAPQPRLVADNVTTCPEAGLAGTILFGEGNGYPSPPQASGTGTVSGGLLDVTINAGWTATGVAVKGGTDTNVYDGPFAGPITIDNMHAPININNQQPFDISHWFVCGVKGKLVPSGGPNTGGGGSQGSGVSFAGLAALGAAGVGGLILLATRRRRNA